MNTEVLKFVMVFTFWNNGNRSGILIRKNRDKKVVMTQQRYTGFRAVSQSIKTNLVVGYDGKLNLNKGITRAETACLLHRAKYN